MGFTYEEAKDRLDCPHINCNYYEVETSISGTYVEGKLTLEKTCRNCEGRDHLMFDVGSHKTDVDFAELGQKFRVNDRLHEIRATEGDVLTVTAIAENPMYQGVPYNEGTVVSVARNLDDDSPYRVGLFGKERFQKILSQGKIEPAE